MPGFPFGCDGLYQINPPALAVRVASNYEAAMRLRHHLLAGIAVASFGCGSSNPATSGATTADGANARTPSQEGPIDLTTPVAGEAGGEPAVRACGSDTPQYCAGSTAPSWRLTDYQPKSERRGKSYGLDEFRGRVVVLAMLAGWCPYCQSQAAALERMRGGLEGKNVAFVVVNQSKNADNDQDRKNLTDRCSFPVLQDTEAAGVWGKHGAAKDDLFIYGADGKLRRFFPHEGGESNLSAKDGFARVLQAVLDALG